MSTELPKKVIAVLGGTGKEGKGLAYRWACSGHPVIIGSRSLEKATQTAVEIKALAGANSNVAGMVTTNAVKASDLVVLTVPYSAHRETLESIANVIQGKLLIDVTVPLVPPRVTRAQMPPAGSAAQEARQILGESAQVCSAFQNISYEKLLSTTLIDCDVLVTGTSEDSRKETIQLVADAGMRGWNAGPIENSMVVEGLTSILIHINKYYNSTSAGIKISGIQQD